MPIRIGEGFMRLEIGGRVVATVRGCCNRRLIRSDTVLIATGYWYS